MFTMAPQGAEKMEFICVNILLIEISTQFDRVALKTLTYRKLVSATWRENLHLPGHTARRGVERNAVVIHKLHVSPI